MMPGTPSYPRNREHSWYFWLDGKQGYPTGSIWARTYKGAKRKIRLAHPGCDVDAVLHYDQYHCLSAYRPMDT